MSFEKYFHLYYAKKVSINISFETSHSPHLRNNSLHINRENSKIARRSFKQRFKLIEKATAAQTHHQVKSFRAVHRFLPIGLFLFFFSLSKSRLHAGMRSNTLNGDQTVVAPRKVIPGCINETLFIIHCNYHNRNADRNLSRLVVFFHANYIGRDFPQHC